MFIVRLWPDVVFAMQSEVGDTLTMHKWARWSFFSKNRADPFETLAHNNVTPLAGIEPAAF